MNTARIAIVVNLVVVGGLALYYLASPDNPQPAVVQPAGPIETVDVLVAKSDIGLGQTVQPGDMQWQTLPSANVSSVFVRRDQHPDAINQFAGSMARSSFLAGEPIRDIKLVKGPGSGIMAAILPTGMRAISTEISVETGAGGFILPNDRVDVLLTRRERSTAGATDKILASTILSNIRVLAIDQTIEEKNGQKVVVGKTATLELRPDQAELLSASRQSGTLSLALRSMADASAPETAVQRRGNTVNIVRFGVQSTTPVQ